MFNPLTQRYGATESIDGGNNNKDNSAAATIVNINEDILLPDKTSIFFLSTSAISIFLPKYGQTVVAVMKCRVNMCLAVARN